MFKNPASLGLAKIKNTVYLFYMKENGAKLQKLFVGTINLLDFRENSKLSKNKRVVFNMKHTFDEGTG